MPASRSTAQHDARDWSREGTSSPSSQRQLTLLDRCGRVLQCGQDVSWLQVGEVLQDLPYLTPRRPACPGERWFVDETYVKVAGRWVYLYRAIDQFGQVIDAPVAEKRDLAATGSPYGRS
jgi:transposase InsO family protein